MSVLEAEKSEVAALSAKLTDARKEIKAKDAELNDLRNRVVRLEDKSVVDDLEESNAAQGATIAFLSDRVAVLEKELGKAERDLAAAGPALALVDALKAI